MDKFDFLLSMRSPEFVHVDCDSNVSSFRSSSSSSPRAPPPKTRKILPPTQDEVEGDLAEELQNSVHSGECNLSQLQLRQVPKNLPLDSLVTLVLSGNKLTELPGDMFLGDKCRHLVRFDANSNRLKTVPRSLFELPNLEVLLLDHNDIATLPFETVGQQGRTFLPALNYVGLEFNDLQKFPTEFFMHCPLLNKVLLGQNEGMLEEPVPSDRLFHSVIAQRYKKNKKGGSESRVILKVDNRPRFVKQMEKEDWHTTLPWLEVELHKIYPDKVLGFMYLGSLRTAQTRTVYRDLNIEYILTIARDLDVRVDPGMKHLVLPVEDIPGEKIIPLFEKAFLFIDEAKKENKGILLHCFAGLSRSVTVAAAYIMRRYNMTRDKALDIIREARPAAQPNPGFMDMLLEYEKSLSGGDGGGEKMN
ncbi:phopshatase, putative [Trypanosoma cruzi marinkellei]|uniref:protein-tyrosine-phosphatase n=1 Tax=Trypanosoma cruzi marinkellei TaxID=85056 RepID=K2PE28_TRYCR|nr:phopshatase, putative [Trypanosoma cruzi marinkellei]